MLRLPPVDKLLDGVRSSSPALEEPVPRTEGGVEGVDGGGGRKQLWWGGRREGPSLCRWMVEQHCLHRFQSTIEVVEIVGKTMAVSWGGLGVNQGLCLLALTHPGA